MACGLRLFPHSKQPLLWSRVHGLRAEDGGPTKRRASSCFCRFSSSALIASCLFISCPCSNLLVRSLGGLMAYFFSSAQLLSPTLCDPMNRSMPGLPVHHQLPESIESVMPSSHLILCCPLLLLPPSPPSIRVFSNEKKTSLFLV